MNLFQTFSNPLDYKHSLALVAASIFLYFLSMPGSPLPLLTFVAFVPLGLAMKSAKPKRSAWMLYLAAIGCILNVIWWLIPAVVTFTDLNIILAFFVLIVFSLMLAIPYAIVGWLAGVKGWMNKPFGNLFTSAAFVVIVTYFPTPLPGNYAHSLYEFPLLLQLLDLGGVPIILFIVVFINLQIVSLMTTFKTAPEQFKKTLITIVVLLLFVMLYGLVKLKQQESIQQEGHHLKIGIVQPKLLRNDSLERLYSLSEKLVLENPSIDLLVWPEFPTAFSYVGNPYDKAKVDRLITKLKKPVVIVSGYIYEEGADLNNPSAQYFNTAHLIDSNKQLKASYRKQTLVPFFEYLPYEDSFPFLRNLFPNTLRYVPGSNLEVFEFDSQTRILPLICYETIFPKTTQDFVNDGGNIIINLTNDIWLGDTQGSEYHFALGMFRAIEHRIPWVRATNSGISGYVSAAGEIKPDSLTPRQSIATRVYEVTIPKERSVYSQYGDVFLYLMVIVLLCGLLKERVVNILK